jgi:diacylglycerol kinase family enzyme
VVEIDGETLDDEFTFVCACNGRFYGGGFNPVPEADPADGLLDVLLVRKVSRLQVPVVIGKYKDGRYQELPHLVRHVRTKKLRVRCDKASPVNLDGEVRVAQVVDFEVAKEKLRFFYPKGLSFAVKETAAAK